MPDKKKIIRISLLIAAGFAILFTAFKIYKNFTGDALIIYGNVDIRTVNLSFRVPGKLASLDVDEGDLVETGGADHAHRHGRRLALRHPRRRTHRGRRRGHEDH